MALATARNDKPPDPRKRAVIVIHGIGNQSPMQTLRGFVHAVWTTDNTLTKRGIRQVWAKVDEVSANLELRRLSTSEDQYRVRTDFFEFYYAHLLEGTSLSTVFWWLWRVLFRTTNRVPEKLRVPWLFGILVTVAFGAAVALFGWLSLKVLQVVQDDFCRAALWAAGASALVILFWILRHAVLVEFLGDAAKYLTAAPANIAARNAIRRAGLDMLKALHKDDDYERIIVVGHSLGSVVGYDILNFFWSNCCSTYAHPKTAQTDLVNIDAAAKSLRAAADAPALSRWREAQRAYARNLASHQDAWKITDFVTLGSPLSHAHVLLVDDREQLFDADDLKPWINGWYQKQLDLVTRLVSAVLARRIAERALPICPPEPEAESVAFTRKDLPGKPRQPHHAAVFAPVRWTNIFAPRRRLLWGDLIGGPIAPLFGPGVRDVALTGKIGTGFFAHTKYWQTKKGLDTDHTDKLRAALNLLDRPENDVWPI